MSSALLKGVRAAGLLSRAGGQAVRHSHTNPNSIWYAVEGHGDASKRGVSVTSEIVIGLGLGIGAGALWKMYHWNMRREIEQYYADLRKLNK